MRTLILGTLTAAVLAGPGHTAEPARQAPKVVLRSADGKTMYDLARLTADGPVLVRLTCTCSGCDQELPFFQKLQTAYDAKGLKTLAVFQGHPEDVNSYAAKKHLHMLWIADPQGKAWKAFDAKVMPTNVLIDKGGRVVTVVAGCARDGKSAQALSGEIARLVHAPQARIADGPPTPGK
jgi:peroxiredoxin